MHVIAAFFLFAASNQDKKTQKEVGVSLWTFTMNANREDLWEGENLWKNRNSRLDFARKHLKEQQISSTSSWTLFNLIFSNSISWALGEMTDKNNYFFILIHSLPLQHVLEWNRKPHKTKDIDAQFWKNSDET